MNEFELYFFIRSSYYFTNLGVFFFLIFFILLILIISYCVLKNKSMKVLFFGSSGSSSSGVHSGTPGSSSSSSGGKDPNKSFWEQYWKIVISSLVAVTVFSSFVIYCYSCYSSTDVVGIEDVARSVGGINRTPDYYFDLNRNTVSPDLVVLSNPGVGQYAPFHPYWEDILRNILSREEFNSFCLRYNISEYSDRIVFTEEFIFSFLSFFLYGN